LTAPAEYRKRMNITSTLSALNNATLLHNSDSSIQVPSKSQQTLKNPKSETPNLFSSFQNRNQFPKNINDAQFQVHDDDPEIQIYEPTKKTRNEEHHINMLANSNGISNHYDKEKVAQKKNVIVDSSTNYEKPTQEEHRSGSYTSDSLSTYNSNSSLVELAHKKEIIDLEDDSPEQETTNEPLCVTDDVISSFQRERENLTKMLLLQNMMGMGQQQIQQPNNQNQKLALMAQLMQLNQLNQLNQRSFLNPQMGFPFYGMGNIGSTLNNPLFFNQQNNLLRQNQFPFAQNDYQDLTSLLMKRPMTFDNQDTPQKINPFMAQSHQSDIIILDDEEETVPKRNERKEEKVRDWSKITTMKGRVFVITKRPYWKKPVFKILTTRKKPYPTLAYEYVGKSLNRDYKALKIGTRERGSLGLSKNYVSPSRSPGDNDEGRRRSTRLRGVQLLEHRENEMKNAIQMRNVEHKEAIEDYVIKLHIDEDEENEDIIDTPIGDDFQVALVPFNNI